MPALPSREPKKYSGSTRQYVNRSPESIWKSWPIQKQKIQAPKNEARGSSHRAARQAVRRIAKLSSTERRQADDAGLDQQAEVHVVGDDVLSDEIGIGQRLIADAENRVPGMGGKKARDRPANCARRPESTLSGCESKNCECNR